MSQLSSREMRLRRHRRVRGKVRGTAVRPRLAVFRSNRGIFAQLVDDDAGTTVAAASWIGLPKSFKGDKSEQASEVGKALADLRRLLGLVALERLRQVEPRRRGDGAAGVVVGELREDAAIRAEHLQARTLRGAADLAAHAAVPALTQLTGGDLAHALFPTFLRTYSPS